MLHVMYNKKIDKNKQKKKQPIVCSLSTFSFGMWFVTDRRRCLALQRLFLSIHDKQQRRVHTYTAEIIRLQGKG